MVRKIHENRNSKSFVDQNDKLEYLTDSLNEIDVQLDAYSILLHQMYFFVLL